MNKRGIQKEGLAKFYARFLAFCSAILRVQKSAVLENSISAAGTRRIRNAAAIW